ncbi:MAG: putative 2OG-Fe(II) oxygenase [Gammaproteobacteria bacterium]
MSIYTRIASINGESFNPEITTGFLANYQRDDVRKTHLFEDRYENIYLTSQHIPALKTLIDEATEHAENILQIKNLRAGFWFNYMPPDSATLIHSHDDDDEILSAVYYVDVPKNSGNLVIYKNSCETDSNKVEIIPRAGDFVFFKPDIRHEVSRNNSTQSRLSIGINFGQPKD